MKASSPAERRPLAVVARLAAAATAACLAGCFSYPVNPPLSHYDLETGYRFRNLGTAAEQAEQDKTFIVLTFSGGGTRAAAFAYGALEALDETKLADDRTLLDEVDVISSVSGGSFASAYLGLFGKQKFFAEFPDAVLNRQIESALIGDVFKPWNWPKLMSPNYGRSDMADAYYDADIFEGRRFADLPLHRPFIVLNATDIGRGAQFSFTQDSFDRICSDLGPVTVSRGVTASSAFPVAFTPLTIKNYGVRPCRYETPLWVQNAERAGPDGSPKMHALAQLWRSYEDTGRRPFIHLSDGGLADNIGLRAIETVGGGDQATPNSLGLLPRLNRHQIERLVIIVVDAKPHADLAADESARPPSIYTVLNAAATNPMENYSSDSVDLARISVDDWNRGKCEVQSRRAACESLADRLCAGTRDPNCAAARRAACLAEFNVSDGQPQLPIYLIHVRFESIPNSDAKARLQAVDTRLQLSKDQVDLLVSWGHRLLTQSRTYQRLVDDLEGAGPPSPCAVVTDLDSIP